MSGVEGVPQMLDFGAFSGGCGDTHDVEADRDVLGDVGSSVGFGELDQLSLLAMIDRIDRGEMVAAGPGFDFDDNDGTAVPGYNVDLSSATAPAALENLIPQSAQLFDRQVLAAQSEVAAGAPFTD